MNTCVSLLWLATHRRTLLGLHWAPMDNSYPLSLTPDCRHVTTSRSVESHDAPSLWMNANQEIPQGFSVFPILCSGPSLNLNSQWPFVLSRSTELISTWGHLWWQVCVCTVSVCLYICACASMCMCIVCIFANGDVCLLSVIVAKYARQASLRRWEVCLGSWHQRL